jgi:hypothetical protein
MFLPREEPKYERLNTSFTDFGALVADLAAQRHTGYLQVTFPDYDGIVLMEAGSVINAVEHCGERRLAGEEALRAVGLRARERNGRIDAYGLPSTLVATLALVANSEVVHRDLSAAFVSLERLVTKLQSDRHTGYIEVTTPANQGLGYIFFRSGEVVEAVVSAEGQQLMGAAALHRLVQLAPESNALLHLYRAVNGGTAPTPAPDTEEPSPAEANQRATASTAAVEVGDGSGVAIPRSIEAWQEIIARIEAVVDGCAAKGTFVSAFKRSLVANATQFPFLDPFAAEFDYRDGRISYIGTADRTFNNAIGFCLRETVRGLANQLKQKNLVLLIRTTLAAPIARYVETIDELDLRATLPELLS